MGGRGCVRPLVFYFSAFERIAFILDRIEGNPL